MLSALTLIKIADISMIAKIAIAYLDTHNNDVQTWGQCSELLREMFQYLR